MRPALRWSAISASGLTAGLLAVNTIGGAAEPPEPTSIELDAGTPAGQDPLEHLDAVRSDLRERARLVSVDATDDQLGDDSPVVRPQVLSGDTPASPVPVASADSPASANSPATADSPPAAAESPASADSPASAGSVDSAGSADS